MLSLHACMYAWFTGTAATTTATTNTPLLGFYFITYSTAIPVFPKKNILHWLNQEFVLCFDDAILVTERVFGMVKFDLINK